MPKISVIIPTYNTGEMVRDSIESVLAQTFADFELIIIDDCSSDKITKEIIADYETKDQRIRFMALDKNSGGPATPTNIGIKSARGEFVAFLDHDDEWMPDKLKKQLALFSLNDKLGLAGCFVDIFDKTGKTTKEIYRSQKQGRTEFLESALCGQFFFSFSILMVPKRVFERIGLLDEKLTLTADQDIVFRILQNYDYDFVSEVLTRYNFHGMNYTNRVEFNFKIKQDAEYLLKKHRSLFERFPRCYARRLKDLAISQILLGESYAGRSNLFRAIQISPNNVKMYFIMVASFFGASLFKKIIEFKRGYAKIY